MTKRMAGTRGPGPLGLSVLLILAGACGRTEKPATPPRGTPAAGRSGTAAPPPGSLGREVREGEAKVSDVVRESTGAGAREIERGKRLPGPTPTYPAGKRPRPRY
jgi:hypothetical protein